MTLVSAIVSPWNDTGFLMIDHAYLQQRHLHTLESATQEHAESLKPLGPSSLARDPARRCLLPQSYPSA